MAQEIADSELIDTWSSSGLIVKPDISKIIEGWQLGEQPPHEYMNWLQNTFGSKLNHILKNGVALWNNETEYLAGSSVQHNGNVWLCKTTNTNSVPTDANANWKRIITVESLTTVLGGYVSLTGNQTIAGTKTFSSSPIVPTPTTDFQATTARSTNITVNVGTGQTYTTINQALEYLSGFYPLHKTTGVTATINLKSGFIMNEQVLVRGLNLGWITIVGEDAETIITHTALTTAFNGTNYPAFGVDKGGTSPVIGQLFRFNVEKVGGNKHGLMTVGAGSSASVLSGKGFIGAGALGILTDNASTINANGANCSNAGTYGIYASNGSTINADTINCSNAGANGIVAQIGSTINADSANCSSAGADGIVASLSSTVNANGANCSNAGINGISIDNASTVNANGANCSNVTSNGIYAVNASTVNANGANCSNAGSVGIYANTASTVNANGAIIQNQTIGGARVVVQGGSHIEASAIDTTGGTVQAFSQAINTLTGDGIIYQ